MQILIVRVATVTAVLFALAIPMVTLAATPAAAQTCDANYIGGCVPVRAADLNCEDLGFAVRIVGSDPHNLDGNDQDGVGCERYGTAPPAPTSVPVTTSVVVSTVVNDAATTGASPVEGFAVCGTVSCGFENVSPSATLRVPAPTQSTPTAPKLALTGDEHLVVGSVGLLLVAAGAVTLGMVGRRRSPIA